LASFHSTNSKEVPKANISRHNTNKAAVLPDFLRTTQTGLLFCLIFQVQHKRASCSVALPDFSGTTQTALLFCLIF